MKANVKTFKTNAEVFYNGNSYHIDYDFQDRNFFDNDKEAESWCDEVLEPIKEAENYDEVKRSLMIVISNYIA